MRTVENAESLRALETRDAAKLARLSAVLGSHESEADWAALLSPSREDRVAIGAEVGGALVGYAAGTVRGGFGLEPSGWLEAFGVDVAWRGRGVGRALAAALLARFRARGAKRVYTTVARHDPSLLPFLLELGFREQPLLVLGRDL